MALVSSIVPYNCDSKRPQLLLRTPRSLAFGRSFRGFRTQSAHHGFHGRAQNTGNAQQRPERDGFAGLEPLPVAHGIAKGNHVFLAVAAALAQDLDTLSQGGKEFALEFGVFGQQCSCTISALN
jgi:hypothetical protein